MTTEPCWRCNGVGFDINNHSDDAAAYCPECDGKKVMPKLWIEWMEPVPRLGDEPDGEVKRRIPAREAVKLQKAISCKIMGLDCYRKAWDALEDFITVHWAEKVYES